MVIIEIQIEILFIRCYDDRGHSKVCCKEARPTYTTHSNSSEPHLAPCVRKSKQQGVPSSSQRTPCTHNHNFPGSGTRAWEGLAQSAPRGLSSLCVLCPVSVFRCSADTFSLSTFPLSPFPLVCLLPVTS